MIDYQEIINKTKCYPEYKEMTAYVFSKGYKILSKAKHILFVANPPYISSDVFPTLESSVKDYEPLSALDGGESGLIYYERLLTILKNYSCVGFFEHGYDQREGLMQLGRQLDLEMSFYSDLQGLDRILKISH